MRNAATSVAPRAGGWPPLLVALLLYALSFAWFYPQLAGVEDEAGFINQAHVWSTGALTAEGAGLPRMPDFIAVSADRHVSWRNPGRSLTLLPVLAAGQEELIFATGALIHVATVLVAGAALAAAGASPLWALLVLCHPTLALYSRTVTADELGGLFLLGAVAVALAGQTRAWAVGLLLGLAVVARYQAAVAVPFVLLVYGRERGWRAAAQAAAIAGAIGLALAWYNDFLYGRFVGPLSLAPGTPARPFTLANVAANLPFYARALLLIWPLQLLALAWPAGPVRRYAWAVCLPVLGLMAAYFFRDSDGSVLADAIVGQRLLQIALPVWIVCYALACRRLAGAAAMRWPGLLAGRRGLVAATLGSLPLLGGQAALFERHQAHLARLLEAREAIVQQVPRGSVVFGNQVLYKLFWTFPACTLFHWRPVADGPDHEHSCRADASPSAPRYVAFLPKGPGDRMPGWMEAMIGGAGASRLAAASAELRLYRLGPVTAGSP